MAIIFPLKEATSSKVVKFLEEIILSIFGMSKKLITYNGIIFTTWEFIEFYGKYRMIS
jgi:hypothetical protein